MPDFLLEIGCEEIPARMLHQASQDLQKRVASVLDNNGLCYTEIGHAETPRRLAIIARGIPASQADTQEQLTGPATKIAYKDGEPTPAAHAFAKKACVDVANLQKVTTPKGEYLAATVTNKGKLAVQVLSELLPKEIASIYWPKNMYWRAGKLERFVRPVRWIVALLDGEIIPLELGGIKAGNQSRGHRILGPEKVAIIVPTQYVDVMRGAHVTASAAERELKIRKALDAATRKVPEARWREDAELLKTVVNLTEWPSVILGSFDKQFLSLPEEVLVTVMRDHQKYFAVEVDPGQGPAPYPLALSNKLAPYFLAVLNTDGDPDGLIRHGNERVLRARFNDARFFWDTDQKTPLVNRVEMLKAVTFQKDLGSYAAKAERMAALAAKLCATLEKSGQKVKGGAVQQATRLAKTDLTAELVKEFTELQGIVGGLYAKAQGLPENVATAIYDQYKPESTEDSAPRTLEGSVLSIADKADSIAGMFALGLVPSGSKDPFALRRQANGIVKTIVEHKLPLNLGQIMEDARAGYQGSEAEKKFTLSGEAYVQAVRGFFRERLEFYLRDVLGLAYDVVNATLAAGADDVIDAVARAEAVAKVRSSPDFESISVAFKRMQNILHQALQAQKVPELFTTYPIISVSKTSDEPKSFQEPHDVELIINGTGYGRIQTSGNTLGQVVRAAAEKEGLRAFTVYVDGAKTSPDRGSDTLERVSRIEIVAKDSRGAPEEEQVVQNLASLIPQIAGTVNALRADREYEAALVEISRMRPAIDAFFDKVMVMVEDENLRAQRLGLLQTLVNEFSSIADFSEIVTERK